MKSFFNGLKIISVLGLFASGSAFAYGGFATIVYNTGSQVWGTSWSNDYGLGTTAGDSFDRSSAEQLAINSCNSNSSRPNTCTVAVADVEARPYTTTVIETWASNGWIALATGPSGAYGTSGCTNAATQNCHDTEQDAETSALNSCNAKAGSNNQCQVVRSFASLTDSWDVDGVHAQ